MSEAADRYARVSEGFTARLEGVPADRWDAPSPCTEWTAAELVGHVISTHRRILANVTGSPAVDLDPSEDLTSAWADATGAVRANLADPAVCATNVGGMFGDQDFETLVSRLLTSDTLVHTWDLARATGQDEHLDPAAVTAAQGFLAPLDEAIRRPGGFAPRIEPAPGADPQTAFLNFCGRSA
jgi:uncharacterized protein (TIGR03086 family)